MTTKFKAIVVEDEALIRRNITKKVHELNETIQVVGEAMNGKEALTLIEEHLPDLVITDIRMPMMDGLELAKQLFFGYPHIKVVIISGHHEFEYARQAIAFQVNEYLLKPIVNEELGATLSRIELQLKNDLESLAHVANSLAGHDIENLIQTIKLYIKNHFHEDLTLKEIAAQLNFTTDYLSKVFKKHTGETPIKYLTRLRINEAKRLLTTNVNMDIKTVGKLVGYPDQHYFSRVFKNNTDYYPSEYRER
ncbi:response regulator transcription factor [Alkalihalobacillus hemicellulosilyticus]|uniref:Helix-turn-helix n=1 Tax=Halalkalibacter hemicellulosilyticusJCM 9152 TaxID=1236971 RepID=W4QH19_9BACI|nr:response regulator [Halalkalibacter hemicellulosilyticus]GAE31381.1 helix-turn-helix [Halalkalibacter hemicellulosilyticusJCM 9152]